VVLYRNQFDGWVAEVPAISGCYALMATRKEALAEPEDVFQMIAAEYEHRGQLWQRTPLKFWSARVLARVSPRRSGSFGALTA